MVVLTPEVKTCIRLVERTGTRLLFVGGSIENGAARDWQEEFIAGVEANEDPTARTIVFNPRVSYWNPNIEQSMNDPTLNRQVNWELNSIDGCDAVVLWFEPNTKSPITLQELGYLAGQNRMGALNKTVVGCPKGFWRKGNVDIMCKRSHIQVVETLDDLLTEGLSLLQRNYERRRDSTI
jgi:hypothetical protein